MSKPREYYAADNLKIEKITDNQFALTFHVYGLNKKGQDSSSMSVDIKDIKKLHDDLTQLILE